MLGYNYAEPCCFYSPDLVGNCRTSYDGDKLASNWLWDVWNSSNRQALRAASAIDEMGSLCGYTSNGRDSYSRCDIPERAGSFHTLDGCVDEKVITNYKHYQQSVANKDRIVTHYPIYLALNLGYACNLHCMTCLENGVTDKYMLDIDAMGEALLEFFQYALEVNLVGGEPTVVKNYEQTLNLLRQVNRRYVSIITNGSNIINKVLPDLDLFRSIFISMDACTAETYEIQRYGGKWDNLLNNIDALLSSRADKEFKIYTAFVITKINMHEIVPFTQWCIERGIDSIYFTADVLRSALDPFKDPVLAFEVQERLEVAIQLCANTGTNLRNATPSLESLRYPC